jgi:hypothetical protein
MGITEAGRGFRVGGKRVYNDVCPFLEEDIDTSQTYL